MKRRPKFDKYFYYKQSVQSPKKDIQFFRQTYIQIFKKAPRIFREDFCGTFYVGYHWVKAHPRNKAFVIDADKKPLEYGVERHFKKLSASQKSRLKILNQNVLDKKLPSAEIIAVSNFSYFVFKQRGLLLKYFKNIKKALLKKGLFIIDVFGGPDCEGISEEKIEHKSFDYYWDQDSFDPISRTAQFYIHFKTKGVAKRKKVFSYHWRMWSIPELREILEDAGFSKTHVYWEQSDKKGDGSGVFKKTAQGEICDTWIAYLVGQA